MIFPSAPQAFRQLVLAFFCVLIAGLPLRAEPLPQPEWTEFRRDGVFWFRIPADMAPEEPLRGFAENWDDRDPAMMAMLHRRRFAVGLYAAGGLHWRSPQSDFDAAAAASGRPELARIGRVPSGNSAGNVASNDFANRFPGLTLALLSYHPTPWQNNMKPPMMAIFSDRDGFDVGEEAYAAATLVMVPHGNAVSYHKSGHHYTHTHNTFTAVWLEEIERLRNPAVIPADGSPVPLRDIPLEDGWVARARGYIFPPDSGGVRYQLGNAEIWPFLDHPGDPLNPNEAYWWFPSERAAREFARHCDDVKRTTIFRQWSEQSGFWREPSTWFLSESRMPHEVNLGLPVQRYGVLPRPDHILTVLPDHTVTLDEGEAHAHWLHVNGNFHMTGGTLNIGYRLTLDNAQSFSFTGGTLNVADMRAASGIVLVNNSFTVSPAGPGRIGTSQLIQYTQRAGGTLAIDIGPHAAADRMTSGVTRFEGGAVAVTLLPGANPQVGDTYDIASGSSMHLDPSVTLAGPDGHRFALRRNDRTLELVFTDGGPIPAAEAPHIALTHSGSTGTHPYTFTANASASTTHNGQSASVRWDFGDGSDPVTGTSASHVYRRPGVYELLVTVTDDQGRSRSRRQTLTINANNTLKPPHADLFAERVSLVPGESLLLDGSRSYDPDGRLVAAWWTVNGERVAEGLTHSVSFSETGVQKVELTVEDNDGLRDTHSVEIHVQPATRVSGIVTLDGAPLADVPVVVRGLMSRDARSDNDGAFAADVTTGRYGVQARWNGALNPSDWVYVTHSHAGQESAELELRYQTGSVSGVVLFEGQPVAGARVFNEKTQLETFTAADGTFTLGGIFGAEETWEVRIQADGFIRETLTLSMPSVLTDQSVVLAPGSGKTAPWPATLSVQVPEGGSTALNLTLDSIGGGHLRWSLRNSSPTLHGHTPGQILQTHSGVFTGTHITGALQDATWDAERNVLWVTHRSGTGVDNRRLYPMNPETGAKGEALDLSALFATNIVCFEWDSQTGHFWFGLESDARIHEVRLNPEGPELLRSFPVPTDAADNTQAYWPVYGLAAGDGWLYVRQGHHKNNFSILKIDPLSGNPAGSITLPSVEGNASQSIGFDTNNSQWRIAWHQGWLWVYEMQIRRNASDPTPAPIWKINPDTGATVESFQLQMGDRSLEYHNGFAMVGDGTFWIRTGQNQTDLRRVALGAIGGGNAIQAVPARGLAVPYSELPLTVTVHAGELPPGTYNNYQLTLRSNDPDLPSFTTTLQVTVGGDVQPLEPPDPPSALQAAAAGTRAITLVWQDNSLQEDGFRIERSPDGLDDWGFLANTGPDATLYTDSGLNPGSIWHYRVRAFNSAGASDWSNTVSATTDTVSTPPSAPEHLSATPLSPTRVDLAWTDTSEIENGFRVQRSVIGASWQTLATLPANSTSYTDNSAQPETEYIYRVEAFNDFGGTLSLDAYVQTPATAPEITGLWNLDFGGTAFAGAGAVGNPGDTWTHRTTRDASTFSMARVGGDGPAVTVWHSQFGGVQNNGTWFPAAQEHLMKSYVHGNGTMELRGLDPHLTYDLYVYGGTPANKAADHHWYGLNVTLDQGAHGAKSTSLPPHVWNESAQRLEPLPGMELTEGVHYVRFENVAPWDLGGGVIGIRASISGLSSGNTDVFVPGTSTRIARQTTAVWSGLQLAVHQQPPPPLTPYEQWRIQNAVDSDGVEIDGTVFPAEQLYIMGAERVEGVWRGLLRIESMILNGDGVPTLGYPTVPGRHYRVWWNNDLTNPEGWRDVNDQAPVGNPLLFRVTVEME